MSKKLLLKFIRRFYNKDLQYIDPLIDQWNKNLVQSIISVLVHGTFTYFFLFGLTFLFPQTLSYIHLGNEYWHVIYSIPICGITFMFIEKFYIFLRKGYKGGKLK